MINFMKNRKIYFSISIALFVIAAVFAMVFGVKLDIQFKGGAIVTYSFTGEVDKAQFQSIIETEIGQKISIQEQTDVVTGAKNYVVSTAAAKGIEVEKQLAVTEKLKETFADNNIETMSINNVDPAIGHQFFLKSLVAVAFASLLILVYVAFRFKKIGGWSAGAMAVVALIHDVIVVFATFIIFRIPINDSFMAVVLTILGYSMNDTIVIYDRIRENERLVGSKMRIGELVDKSINQSLFRSMMTTTTTLIALTTISIVALIYNVNSILYFTFPMIIGMISGVYSSICIAGPLWVMWQERKLAKKHK